MIFIKKSMKGGKKNVRRNQRIGKKSKRDNKRKT